MESSNFSQRLVLKGWNSVWTSFYLLEAVLISVGNAATIAVFWRRHVALKRASLLLINLSVADILSGVGLFAFLVLHVSNGNSGPVYIHLILGFLPPFFTTASICSLTVIAVERALAITKPLKHRAAPTAYYYRAIYLVWVVSIAVTVVLGLFYQGLENLRFVPIIFYVGCLLTIFLSYFAIWRSSINQFIEPNHVNGHERNRKLAKTLAIVTFLSVCTWLPMQILAAFPYEEAFFTYGEVFTVLLFLALLNSVLNPFVYALRIPEFRQELKRLFCGRCCRGRQEMIPMASVIVGTGSERGAYSLSAGEAGSYKQRDVY